MYFMGITQPCFPTDSSYHGLTGKNPARCSLVCNAEYASQLGQLLRNQLHLAEACRNSTSVVATNQTDHCDLVGASAPKGVASDVHLLGVH